MPTTGGFFDLSKDEVAELAIHISETDDGCLVNSNAGALFEISNCTQPDERRDPGLYSVIVGQTAFVGERESRPLIAPTSGATLGYVFPVTAFRDSDNFDGLWPRRFADIGFKFATMLPNLAEFGNSVSTESLRGQRVYLDQVFNDALSIVVLGRAVLDQMTVGSETLELMLFKEGIDQVRSRHDVLRDPPSWPWRNRVKLTKPGKLVEDEAAVFLSLLRSADRDRLGIGAFMHIYQAIEFCIDHIFGWGVKKIAVDQPDTWEMKNRLSQITGEAHRLSLLDADCLSTLPSRDSLNQLADCCRDFLKALNVEFSEESPWHKLLYRSRNIIVHNQIMMMKVQNLPLQELVSALRTASMEILFSFAKPTALEPL